jgi:hypothetical protein
MTMVTAVDFKGSSASNGQPTNGQPTKSSHLQYIATNTSKAAEENSLSQNQQTMATIADDDDRLLERIGYTPVSPESPTRFQQIDQHYRFFNVTSHDGPPCPTPSLF